MNARKMNANRALWTKDAEKIQLIAIVESGDFNTFILDGPCFLRVEVRRAHWWVLLPKAEIIVVKDILAEREAK